MPRLLLTEWPSPRPPHHRIALVEIVPAVLAASPCAWLVLDQMRTPYDSLCAAGRAGLQLALKALALQDNPLHFQGACAQFRLLTVL
ncbi:hypothetical protein NDU88_007636 [Pleurodeles waltl]|uniref:Uncharacterized protein n=1 Tax=Pleurodeles waltl TaxID=8319 RepID=A0AAV7RVN5_PLEWA|nr:hypothetical protein NDU88_007636 [Pleurodeles waltl]